MVEIKEVKNVLILIDQNTEQDRRVLFFKEKYEELDYKVSFLDVRDLYVKISFRRIIFALWKIFILCVLNFNHFFVVKNKIKKELDGKQSENLKNYKKINYLKISYKETIGILFKSFFFLPNEKYSIVHANDLKCLIFCSGVDFGDDVRIIYDSHELNIFRNRPKKSLLRFYANVFFESLAIKKVNAIFVVSPPIKDFLERIYSLKNIFYIENGFYAKDPIKIEIKKEIDEFCIVYIGVINHGRGLKELSKICSKHPDVKCFIFAFGNKESSLNLLGEFSLLFKDNVEIVFPHGSDISCEIGFLRSSFKCVYSWCYIQPLCLSYEMALPNKFFQSILNFFPLIVSNKTYLSEIVKNNVIGIVLSDNILENGKEIIDFPEFIKMNTNMFLKNIGNYLDSINLYEFDDKVKNTISSICK